MTDPEVRRIQSAFRLGGDGIARGFAYDPDDPAARLVVEIRADDLPIALVRAEEPFSAAEGSSPVVGAFCGFSVPIDAEVLARARRLEARLANCELLIGVVQVGGIHPFRHAEPEPIGHARWAGGLRITGHVAREAGGDPMPVVRALVDGVEVARTVCRSWIQLGRGQVARSFDLYLPADLADGRVRPVEVMTDTGPELPGSPCLAVAFPDALSNWIDGWAEVHSETIRARFADGLLPQSLPIEVFEDWLVRFPPRQSETSGVDRIAVVLVGDGGRDASLASLDAQTSCDWSAAALAARGSPVAFDPQQLRAFLQEDAANCPLVVVAPSGTVFAPDALSRIQDAARRFPEVSVFYPDLILKAVDGRLWPLAFPAFDPELYLETGYCGLVYAMRHEAALAAVDGSASLYDLFPIDDGGLLTATPVHIPAPLATLPEGAFADLRPSLLAATLRRISSSGIAASVQGSVGDGLPSVVVERSPAAGMVCAVIAVRNTGPALEHTLSSLRSTAGLDRLRVVVADNGSTDPATCDILDAAAAQGHIVVSVPGWFCVPHLLNRGAQAAAADHFLFIEPGVVASGPGWLDEMMGRVAGRDVGAVAPLVAWTTGVIRDAGFVLGPRLSVVPRFIDRMIDDDGYAGLLKAAHECSAVSATCMLTPRRLFEELGGFDVRHFPRRLYAADYCQRLRASGRRLILTPHARFDVDADGMMPADPSGATPWDEREAGLFRYRWSVAPGCDPFYSPWMTMDGTPYSGLAWPPGPCAPRQPARPLARPIPLGF